MDSKEKNAQAQAPKEEKRDWLQLLIVPVVLAVVGGTITYANNQVQQDIAEQNNKQQQQLALDKQKDEVLRNYIEDMKGLLLDKDHPLLKSKNNDDVSRTIARTLTITTLNQLTSEQENQKDTQGRNHRKALVLRFLSESQLINNEAAPSGLSIVILGGSTLEGANFSGASLSGANLEDDNLNGVNLRKSDLSHAILFTADLSGAKLAGANFSDAALNSAKLFNADLTGANLARAKLIDADLSQADLASAKFIDADLSQANFSRAVFWSPDLKGKELTKAKTEAREQIQSTRNWTTAHYDPAIRKLLGSPSLTPLHPTLH
jgi:uncharacterized protein YjbI with pentapeptide repeats